MFGQRDDLAGFQRLQQWRGNRLPGEGIEDRDDFRQKFADDFGSFVTGHAGGGRIHQGDASGLIGDDYAVAERLKGQPGALFHPGQRGAGPVQLFRPEHCPEHGFDAENRLRQRL